jgi:hypothetical protein
MTNIAPPKTKGAEKREELRKLYWPNDIAWIPERAKGWFRAPRTIPLVLALLRSKGVDDKSDRNRPDPTRAYLALLARHMGGGVVEVINEAELAYESGYTGNRAVRTWQERMDLLLKLGLIKVKGSGIQKYRYVLLVHPAYVIEQFVKASKVDERWLNAYEARRLEAKESTYEVPAAAATSSPKVVDIKETLAAARARIKKRNANPSRPHTARKA